MARRKKRNASRGSVNNIIIKTLVTGDKYGYEIIKQVEELSGGKIKLKQPSLYSSLSRFEEKQFVTSYWGDSDIGGRRHYYHLTESGLEYYKKYILKEDDVEDITTSENSQTWSTSSTTTSEHNADSDNDFESDIEFEDDDVDYIEEQRLVEIDENDIPTIVSFDDSEDNDNDNDYVEDHVFYKPTPIDTMIINNSTTPPSDRLDNLNNNNSNNTMEVVEGVYDNSDILDSGLINNDEQSLSENDTWNELVESTKRTNKNLQNSKYNKLYLRKPKKIQRIIKDKDGIIKLRDEDYVPTYEKYEPIIIDNVGSRTSPIDIYGYAEYTQDKKPTPKTVYSEISEEEKIRRNENFLAKFNLLTMSKMKPVATPITKPVENKVEKQVDYRGELDKIYGTNQLDDFQEEEQYQSQDNKMFDYDDDIDSQDDELIDDDPIVELESFETFDVKETQSQYIDEMSNLSAPPPTQVHMTRYENTTKAVLDDKTYLLINKLKFTFGIIMVLIMSLEIGITWILLNKHNLITGFDCKAVLIASCVIIGIFGLINIVPFISNSNMHKANTFKFKYTIWFGILTFLVSIILTYCINALNGFQLDNFNYFATTLIVPIVMTFNFVIGPIVYFVLTKFKTFYD